MAVADPTITPQAMALLACYEIEMKKVADPPASVCLRTGEQVALLAAQNTDECCTGLAWVRVANVYPSANFPEPDSEPSNCGPIQWAVVLELGAARCAPTADAYNVPTCEQWLNVSKAVLDDRAAMVRAVCCWAADTTAPYLLGQWLPWPTEGGCVGGTMTVTVAAPFCECAPTVDDVGAS